MKYTYLLIVLFITSKGLAQADVQKQKALDSAYHIATNITKPIEERLNAFSYCCWKSVYSDFNQGLQYSAEYLELAKTSKNHKRTSQAYHFLGHTYMMLGDIDNAKNTLIEGLDFSIQHKTYLGIAKIYGDLGNLNNSIGNASLALDYHFKSLDIANKHEINVEYARSKINIGEIYEAQGQYKLSLETFEEALNFCIDHNYIGYMASIYESLGDINVTIKEYKTAEKNYTTAISYAKRLSNNNRLINALNKIGELHLELNNLSEAKKNYNAALDIAATSKAVVLEANVRTNLAHLHLQQNETKAAKENITWAIQHLERLNIKDDLDKAYVVAAKTYQALNQKKESITYYNKAYQIAKTTNNINTLKLASYGLAEAYEEDGDLSKALMYYKEFNNYNNQVRNKEGIQDIIRIELQDVYHQKSLTDSITKANEFKLLQYEYEKKEERNKLKNYTAVSSIIILIIIVLCITYFYYQKKKVAAVLAAKNSTIKEALSDKEILLKEVNHRVKNNMQVVSSLLHLKSKNTLNELAKEVLMDSKKRIDALQLAHQKMYLKGNYKEIDVLEYFNDIVDLILKPIKSEQDSFTVQGEELWINVEQAQTLGFILHELIANSIKHAWDKNNPKIVKVSILKSNNTIAFNYTDNGKGLPKDIDITTIQSFGMKLIYSLVTRQLLGKIRVNNTVGCSVNIKFNAR
ncbi:tetratricopeptide repeat-containing sensor histidine kinase [Winogradskyella psychrotolerans]|uniref:tetratricopeptide repeat-containing sensor histidine kinase n=1 Tax=Winogradskyella psychrotolerans TaxID=1344585 RepID=UPI001C069BEE|nr:tetratricopeptide repeat protein [Winogradskyella psychrotolerans]MBU2929142.1 tetratricopeptide repeat protein [Winogradskyella psychrotolerans]